VIDQTQAWQLFVAALVGFFAGAINPASLISRARGINIHEVGSGNPGATNAARALGKSTGVLVGLIDVLKGFIPTVLFSLWGPGIGEVAGLAAVLGHIFSPFLGGKGGKGVATTLGVVLGVQPLWAVPMLVAFGLTVSITKRVGIGAVAGAVVLIAMGIWLTDSLDEKLFAITLGMIVIVRHQQNLRDLVASRHPKD